MLLLASTVAVLLFGLVLAPSASADVAFTRAWGEGVADGKSQPEVCTSSCQIGTEGIGAGELANPEGVAVDSHGGVFVGDTFDNRVDEFASSGAFVRAWGEGVADGKSQPEVCTSSCQIGNGDGGAGDLTGPSGAAVDSHGNVFVGDTANERVDEFASSGVFVRAWGWGVADGKPQLEVCSSSCQRGIQGGGAGELKFPEGVAVDFSGDVFVADAGNNRVDEFTSSGAFVRAWGEGVADGKSQPEVCTSSCQTGTQGGGAGGEFDNPVGVAVDSSGDLLVGGNYLERVDEFTSSGGFVRAWGWGVSDGKSQLEVCTSSCQGGLYGGGAGEFEHAEGVAVGSSGDVFVADYDNHRVDEFTSSGGFLRAWGWGVNDGKPQFEVCTSSCQPGISGGGAGELATPVGVAVDSAGDVFVADRNNQRIDEFATASSGAGGGGVNPTSSGVSCSPATISAGQSTTCTVTVTDTASGGQTNPTGTVSFSSDAGYRPPDPIANCTLSGVVPTITTSSCSATYTPSQVGSGTHTITGSYGGDATHSGSSGSTSVSVSSAKSPGSSGPGPGPGGASPFVAGGCEPPGPQPHPMVQGIEVTQGIQTDALPYVDEGCGQAALLGGSHPSASYPSGPLFNPDGTVNHVALVAGRTTVVRVYADSVGLPAPPPTPVDAVLWAFRDGKLIPSSAGARNPMPEDGLSRTLSPGSDGLTRAERIDPDGGFQFTIPAAWAQGKVTFVAQINPPEQSQGQTCFGCGVDDLFTLRDVTFTAVRPLWIRVATMPVGDQRVPVADALSRLQSVLPIPESSIRLPEGAADGTVQISSDDACNGGLLDAKLNDWGQGQTFGGGASVNRVLGLVDQSCQSGGTHPKVNDAPTTSLPDYPYSVAAATRPLTSVAHELTHGFGQPHAGRRCPASAGVPLADPQANPSGAAYWPPDDEGLLQGIGLDIHRSAAGTFNDYQTIAAPSDGSSQFYDYMSYCVGQLGTDTAAWERQSWISPRTWDQLVEKLVLPGTPSPGRAVARAQAAAPGAALRVVATPQGGGAQILDVAATSGSPSPAAGGPYQLVVRDGSQHVIDTVAMQQSEFHVDFAPSVPLLIATVPADAAAELDVVHDGQVVARRVRPASAPTVRLLAPRPGAVVGRCKRACTVRVRWRTVDRLHLPLTAAVDYAPAAGAAWRTLALEPDRQAVTIPTSLLARGAHARIRIRVSDGFNETDAVSRPFRALGAPPTVEILSPLPHARLRSDSVPLRGQAYDDAGRPLAGHALRWFAGRRLLGTGSALAASGVPPGTRRITLVARDHYGRSASATVPVGLKLTPPRFLLASAPSALSAHANRVTLRISALAPASLTVTGRGARRLRGRVGTRARAFVVRVHAGRSPLKLRLTLAAGRARSSLTLTIAR